VSGVEPGSPAAEVGIVPGDRIVEIDGQPLGDLIDYYYQAAQDELTLRVIKSNGEEWVVDLERVPGRALGIDFDDPLFDGLRRCRNRCVFCFLEQMPKGLRPSLYLRDDDYRLSFLHGNFITLSNLTAEDLDRIVRLRLSPLYVSVHATDPAARRRLMRAALAGDVLGQLRRLVGGGIALHTQIVLCPGLNDGEVLNRTVEDLAALWPGVASVGVVPVGLTAHREGLPFIHPVTREQAAEVIAQVGAWRRRLAERGITDLLFLADEFYVLAGRTVPAKREYAGFPQLENGIGLIRRFLDDFRRSKRRWPARVAPRRVTVVTGASAFDVINRAAGQLSETIDGLRVDVLRVTNQFFGPAVTVAGLLSGRDIGATLAAAGPDRLGDEVLVPAAAVREEDGRFLDDLTPEDLAGSIGRPVKVVEARGDTFARAVIGEGATA
jgi:putative radical SAM enzyme (TIGR03279 family)